MEKKSGGGSGSGTDQQLACLSPSFFPHDGKLPGNVAHYRAQLEISPPSLSSHLERGAADEEGGAVQVSSSAPRRVGIFE